MSVLEIPVADYHADKVGSEQPTLSASVAKVLIAESPAHAKAAHPRLTDAPVVEKDEAKFDLGTAVHSMFLEQDHSNIDVLDYDDWRTNAAKAAREESRSYGRVPMLRRQYDQAVLVSEIAREKVAALKVDPPMFTAGKAEQTLVWTEPNGVVCRARLDWLPDSHRFIDDLKTTGTSANPHSFQRTLFNLQYDLSAAFYLRGLKAVEGVDAEFRWAVVEVDWPHEVVALSPAPDALALAEDKVQHAIDLWGKCLAENDWPGYDGRLHYVEAPPWAEAQWMERVA